MLSIIVSSYQKDYFNQFSENVLATIGENFVYEIVQIWNPGTMGICEAYNKGAEQAQYNNLLFVHEDVLFETEDWGKILCNYLREDKTGCIGIAGANYVPYTPSPWWIIESYRFSHLSHYNANTKKRFDYTFTTNNTGLQKCKLLDGVFIACRKDVWGKVKFNQTLKGFHGYDILFSLVVSKNYQNFVTNQILLVHYSAGSLTKEWLKNVILAYKLADIRHLNIDKKIELIAFKYFADQIRYLVFDKKEIMQYLKHFISFKNLGLINWLKAKRKIEFIKKHTKS